MKKYEPWGWYPNIQISIETIWVSKLNNKISGSLRNVQPMPLTSCRRLTQASEPITALTSSIMLFQHWSTFNSNNQWTSCAGTYYPLTGMSDDVQQQLIDDHFLFKEGDRFLQVSESDLKQSSIRCMSTGSKCKQILANRPRHFPQRGEDVPSLGWWRGPPSHHLHGARLRCWSCVPAADRRDRTHGSTSNCQADICMCLFLQDSLMSFTSDERLGWLTFCPTNLGTAIRFALWNGQSRDIFLI